MADEQRKLTHKSVSVRTQYRNFTGYPSLFIATTSYSTFKGFSALFLRNLKRHPAGCLSAKQNGEEQGGVHLMKITLFVS